MTTKFCKGCVFRENFSGHDVFDEPAYNPQTVKCMHGAAMVRGDTYLVDGFQERLTCQTMRREGTNRCGPEGLFWEEKR